MATPTQTANLVLQIVMLGLLGYSLILYRRRKFMQHAHLMTLAFGINIASITLVMTPSLYSTAGMLLMPPIGLFNIVSIVHIPFGVAALLLSGYVVFRWASHSFSTQRCRGKLLMRATFVAWTASILMGITIFFTMTS